MKVGMIIGYTWKEVKQALTQKITEERNPLIIEELARLVLSPDIYWDGEGKVFVWKGDEDER